MFNILISVLTHNVFGTFHNAHSQFSQYVFTAVMAGVHILCFNLKAEFTVDIYKQCYWSVFIVLTRYVHSRYS